MKVIITVLFLFMTSIIAVGQEKNEKRLSEIDAEISVAVINENYGYADTLSQEKALRLEIREAANNDDFVKVQRLQKKLERLYPENIETNSSTLDTTEIKNVENNTKNSVKLKSGAYILHKTTLGVFLNDYTSMGGGFTIGEVKYFRKKNEIKNYRMGFKGQFSFSYYYFNHTIMIDIFQVGPHLSVPLRKNTSLECGILAGMSIEDDIGDSIDTWPDFEMSVYLQLLKFSIGFDCNVIPIQNNYSRNSSILRFGIGVGIKI